MNYWFLYNTANGSIYGSPYLGNADEWTNIPEGCAVLGPIDASSANAQVVDAFSNPDHYIVQNNELTAVSNITQLQLTKAQNAKIVDMTNAYNQVIYSTFQSNAFDGTTMETYACDQVSQSRINGEATTAMAVLQGYTNEPVSWKNINQSQCVPWQPRNMINLGMDLHKFITAQTNYLEALIVYINSLTDVDKVNEVTWGMTIPTTT